MPPVPREVLLEEQIKLVDGEITLEWARIAEVIRNYKGNKPNKDLFGEFTRVRYLMTRRHALELERTYGPRAQILFQPKLVGIRTAEGEFIKARELRIPDAGIALEKDFLRFVEVKTEKEIIDSISKASGVVSKYNESTKIHEELAKEKRVFRWGAKRGTDWWIEYQDPVTRRAKETDFPVSSVFGSLVQSYNNMGDGIELSALFDAASPPSAKSGKAAAGSTEARPAAGGRVGASRQATESRATENTGVDSRSRGGEAKAEATTAETPTYSLSGGGKPVREMPLSKVQFPVDPGGSLERQKTTAGAVEGAALTIYQGQLQSLSRAAMDEALADVKTLEATTVQRFREKGEWVLVTVEFAEPKTPDVFGLEGDSYPIYWGATVSHAPQLESPSGQVTYEQQLHALRHASQGFKADYHPQKGREMPPGRKLVPYEYAVYPPLPPTKPIEDPLWSPVKRATKWRGVQDRCTK